MLLKTRETPKTRFRKGHVTLKLRFTNLRSDKGRLRVALFNKPKGFPEDFQQAYRVLSLQIVNKQVTATIDNLPMDQAYALCYYHDENGNVKLDKNLIGQPVEDYGFSGGAKGLFGPPSFSKARFRLEEPTTTLAFRVERVRSFGR